MYEQIFKLLRHDLVENLNVDSIKNHKELYTIHKIYDDDEVIDYGELPLSNESVGTQRLFLYCTSYDARSNKWQSKNYCN